MKQCNATIKNFKNGNPLTPLVLSSPHSGKFYPKEFLKLSQIPIETLKQSEDSLVDDLLSTNSENNNVLLSANWSRSVIDVNRAINDFNENNFDPPITKYKSNPSKYSRSGLGVIPSRSINNELIYKNLIPGDISTEWLDKNIDKVKILDASWHLPNSKRDAMKAEYKLKNDKNKRQSICKNFLKK